MIQLRLIEIEKDYPAFCDWWAGHGWPALPKSILPKRGVMACDAAKDGAGVAAAWLYMDNSTGVSMMEWLVTNPQSGGKETLRAINAVIGFLTERALELDYGMMLTSCRQPSLVRVLEKNGFRKTDEGVTHLLKITSTMKEAE